MSACAVAGVAARLIRALQECNIFNAAWLPRNRFLPAGRLVAIPARVALMAVAAVVMGAMAVLARTAMAAAIATLLVAAMRLATVATFRLLRGGMGPRTGAAVG